MKIHAASMFFEYLERPRIEAPLVAVLRDFAEARLVAGRTGLPLIGVCGIHRPCVFDSAESTPGMYSAQLLTMPTWPATIMAPWPSHVEFGGLRRGVLQPFLVQRETAKRQLRRLPENFLSR